MQGYPDEGGADDAPLSVDGEDRRASAAKPLRALSAVASDPDHARRINGAVDPYVRDGALYSNPAASSHPQAKHNGKRGVQARPGAGDGNGNGVEANSGGAGAAERDSGAAREFQSSRPDGVYGALDLGTNNCRLLLARPSRRGFRVIDAFSRIIRLGEGMAQTGQLSEPAMTRTLEALKVCAAKLGRANVRRSRLVATEACRIAKNGDEFLQRVRDKVGLEIEILTPELEARLAVSGCAALIDASCDYVLVFDIGGGSSELILLDLTRRGRQRDRRFAGRLDAQNCMVAWTSLPVGVVTLAERFGGRDVTPDAFEAMVAEAGRFLVNFEQKHNVAARLAGRRVHMLGTSGTVTTVAGIQLGLPRYDRNRVDGCWLDVSDVREVTADLLGRSYEQRVAEPCIGRDRADLVLAGCAILEAILRMWPCERLRVADRGLREGILTTLMVEDGVLAPLRRRRRPI
ncbi:Exopolyphosphatase [Hyphomicrobium sulfonivorans]|uniref:Exopolyphosphatase n=1 Tax=Hyphomicrobium sulfonivorans TaxID=121290 RepID=A0A125NW22_HYPSL|nr:Ppx/GppA phosphatase family protein [Hyphomicrobium sulfonivorans]KWT71593.1 Exopolyphosphatase [Hyphomicrobium sulfonivorans]